MIPSHRPSIYRSSQTYPGEAFVDAVKSPCWTAVRKEVSSPSVPVGWRPAFDLPAVIRSLTSSYVVTRVQNPIVPELATEILSEILRDDD